MVPLFKGDVAAFPRGIWVDQVPGKVGFRVSGQAVLGDLQEGAGPSGESGIQKTPIRELSGDQPPGVANTP